MHIFLDELKGKSKWKESGAWEFISNVIGMASEGINLMKITGVHPLCDFVDRLGGPCLQSAASADGIKINDILFVKRNYPTIQM